MFSSFRVTDRYKLTQALVVDPLYLQHSYSESAIDYRVRIPLICLYKRADQGGVLPAILS